MQKQVAKHIVASALKCSSQLNQILPFAKIHCDNEEYREILSGVARVLDSIGVQIIDGILASHPDLKQEIDDSITKYGVFI
jgi:hypothetical protein